MFNSTTGAGNGGDLIIKTNSLQVLDGAVITNVESDLNSGVVEAPILPIDATALITQDTYEIVASGSSFIVKPKGGKPPSPTDLLDSRRPIVKWSSRPDPNRDSRVSKVSSQEEKTATSQG